MRDVKETDLYPPIKAFLEGQGYEVKGEVGAADVVAKRRDEAPVIVELKVGFSLSLFHQGVERQALSDWVYIAVPRGSGQRWSRALKDNMRLCRRLGLGLLTVRLKDGFVEPHLDPGPYAPRLSKPKQQRLLREFARRVGDPNAGGATRARLITAYRQDALRCAVFLSQEGASKGAAVKAATGVDRATALMAADHYGWFERVEKGIYQLTSKGVEALEAYEDVLAGLTPPAAGD